LYRFAQLSPRRRLLIVEALGLLLWSKVSLKLVAFSRLVRGIGQFMHPADPRAAPASHRQPMVGAGTRRLVAQ
jgi:hypothetical protein